LIPIPLLSFLIFIPGLIRTLRLKDQLYERLYTEHRELWQSLGRPRGWQWSPPDTWASSHGFRDSVRWLSRTDPPWLAEAPELRDLFYEYRTGSRHWNFVAMPIFFAGLLVFGLVAVLNHRLMIT
jgi:hypothetical protein